MKSSLKRNVVIIFSVIAILTGYIIYMFEYRENKIDSVKEKTYELKIYEVGWSHIFGKSTIRLKLLKNGETVSKVDSQIENEGMALNKYNYDVSWKKDGAYIVLKGYDNRYSEIYMYFSGRIRKRAVSMDFIEKYNSEKAKKKIEEEKRTKRLEKEREEKEAAVEKNRIEKLKSEYKAVSEFLNVKKIVSVEGIKFMYNAKGDMYALLNENDNGKRITLYLNENYNEKGESEFVLYSEVVGEDGEISGEKTILGFFIFKDTTKEVVDENRVSW